MNSSAWRWAYGIAQLSRSNPSYVSDFGLDTLTPMVHFQVNGYNVYTFPYKESHWSSSHGKVKWILYQEGGANFCLRKGHPELHPVPGQQVVLTRTEKGMTVSLYCEVEESHLQSVGEIGIQLSSCTGTSVLKLNRVLVA